MIHYLQHTTSTNDIAMSDEFIHGDVVWAEWQSAGRGQRGNKWLSGEGLNLTFSAILEPRHIDIRDQFLIVEIAALSLVEALAAHNIDAKIKWPNDIYVGDKKICGMLIENQNRGGTLTKSVVGIGLNVMQRTFDTSLPNPTSMILEQRGEYDRRALLEEIHTSMLQLFELSKDEIGRLHTLYLESLYRRDEWHYFQNSEGVIQEGAIRDIEPTGEIKIESRDGSSKKYLFKEITYII